ncbi:MAG: hypothetical protein Q9162_007621 [Coniocarpon cinnabarinum]
MTSALLLLLTAVALSLSIWVWQQLRNPLNSIPGPLLARFTNIWRLIDVWNEHSDVTQLRLHRKYGHFVRLGPNCVTISDPALIKTLYSTRNPYLKSDFYTAGDNVVEGKSVENHFSARNEQLHDYILRPIKSSFSLTSVLKFEGRVDSTLDYFVEKLKNEYAMPQLACPINEVLAYFAFDVIGEMTFSSRLGLLDGDPEMRAFMKQNEKTLNYLGLVGQMPWLGALLRNRFVLVGQPKAMIAANFAAKTLLQRRNDEQYDPQAQNDFVDLFIQAEKDSEEGESHTKLSDRQMAWMIANVVAGSDTTAAALQAAIYYVARDEKIKSRLVNELRSLQGVDHVSWKACQQMSYLDAVVKETLRFAPSVGLPLERVVPTEGLQLSNGSVLPQGTLVGINPRVVNHDSRTYGASADEFMPERWLKSENETEGQYQARLDRMKEADLTFGAGRRTCTGRNIAVLETYKCVARLFRDFDVSCNAMTA